MPIPRDLPGAELIESGLSDLAAGDLTPNALLVAIGAPRLRALGIDVPTPLPDAPEHALFLLLAARGDDAHSAFDALRRRLVSFQRALERRASRADPPTG
ncbi:MAG: hypothetical protein R3F59_23180 [Myxococcota bacterium]